MKIGILQIATCLAVTVQVAVGATFFGAIAAVVLTSYSVLPLP